MRPMQVKTEFNLTIYPNGQGWDKKDDDGFRPTLMYFANREQKEAYVKAEYVACKKERAAFNGAVTAKEREELRIKLLTKQAYFARTQGWSPSIKSRNEWYFTPKDDKVHA